MKRIEVFENYGITYDTKTNKILAPWGEYIPLPLKEGNSKVGKKAYAFSMTHGNEIYKASEMGNRTAKAMHDANVSEIKGSCACHCKHCYCDSGCYNFDSTKASNMINLILARLYTDFLKRAIIAQIEAFHIEQVRIHASGDFLSDEYIDMWKCIVTTFLSVKFWTYTKVENALTAFQNVSNLPIVPSNTPYGVNYGTCKEVLEMYEKLTNDGYNVHVCACGTPYEKHCCDCETGCKAIGDKIQYVLFILHSTRTYKAGENDIDDYNEVLKLIEKQEN